MREKQCLSSGEKRRVGRNGFDAMESREKKKTHVTGKLKEACTVSVKKRYCWSVEILDNLNLHPPSENKRSCLSRLK
jgi:hypothetical protein